MEIMNEWTFLLIKESAHRMTEIYAAILWQKEATLENDISRK